MYELEYVKKRKKCRRAVIIGAVATMGITTFSIIAFLGRYVGTFTVSLEAKNVELTLSENSSFTDSSSYLSVSSLPSFQEFTYTDFNNYGGKKALDDEKVSTFVGANPENESINFFKYTFFLKNAGTIPAKYNLSLKIKESVAASDGRTLDDTLRVMVFDNGEDNVYAKGSLNYSAPIAETEIEAEAKGMDFPGYAINFASASEIMRQDGVAIESGEVRRYTIVTWLEGSRSSNKTYAPKGASIKLGVEINAYEKE